MSKSRFSPARRTILKSALGAGALAALGPLAVRQALAAEKLTVGVIYVGPRDDFGYNQAHAQAAAIIKQLPNVNVVEEEKRPRDHRRTEDHGGA